LYSELSKVEVKFKTEESNCLPRSNHHRWART